MELKCFPYTTTNRLVKYSKLVTKAIASFNRNNASTLGTIAYDPSYGIPPDEDRLEYWDKWDNDITFGRYLMFTKKKEENEDKESKKVILFWTGLSTARINTIYCIWFKKENLPKDYDAKFKKIKSIDKLKQESKDGKEVWIQMENAVFTEFCNSCTYHRRQKIKKLWQDVLGAL